MGQAKSRKNVRTAHTQCTILNKKKKKYRRVACGSSSLSRLVVTTSMCLSVVRSSRSAHLSVVRGKASA